MYVTKRCMQRRRYFQHLVFSIVHSKLSRRCQYIAQGDHLIHILPNNSSCIIQILQTESKTKRQKIQWYKSSYKFNKPINLRLVLQSSTPTSSFQRKLRLKEPMNMSLSGPLQFIKSLTNQIPIVKRQLITNSNHLKIINHILKLLITNSHRSYGQPRIRSSYKTESQ